MTYALLKSPVFSGSHQAITILEREIVIHLCSLETLTEVVANVMPNGLAFTRS